MSKRVQLMGLALSLIALTSCGGNKVNKVKNLVGLGEPDRTAYSGPVYPATQKIAIAFQPAQVARSCRVFAEVLVQVPANSTGREIEQTVLAEAGKRGAEQVLIGQTRQASDDEGPQFLYYGPEKEYLCADQCGGWKYGYSTWEKQGEWVTLGYKEWGRTETRYETPLVTQLAMLRCQ